MTPYIKIGDSKLTGAQGCFVATMWIAGWITGSWLLGIWAHNIIATVANKEIDVWKCAGALFLLNVLTPKAIKGIWVLALLVAQIYIWFLF